MTSLNGKIAVVFGAGGSVGAPVAKTLAARGAEVFLSGRSSSNIEAIKAEIADLGGRASASVVDAEDDSAVETFIDGVVKQAGRIDIVFNAFGPRVGDYGNGKLAVDLTVGEYMIPLTTLMKSQFITARAAARRMVHQGFGAIIFLTGSPARGHVQGATAIGTAFGAIETFVENLAVELGPHGVRVVCLRTTANTDTRTIQETMDAMASQLGMAKAEVVSMMAGLNWLKIPAKVADTANAIAFLASDDARFITGTVVNASAGAAPD